MTTFSEARAIKAPFPWFGGKSAIAVCGYDDGREVPPGWRVLPWATVGGYGNQAEAGEGRANARRERVWFSPACIPCEGDIDCATGEAVRGVGQLGLAL